MSIYRAPNSNWHMFFDKFEQSINLRCNRANLIFITGDFNIHFGSNNDFERQFMNLISMYGLFITNNKPTRITKYTATCLDNILINNNNTTNMLENFEPVLSDHSATLLTCNYSCNNCKKTKQHSYKHIRCITEKKLLLFSSLITSCDWNDV